MDSPWFTKVLHALPGMQNDGYGLDGVNHTWCRKKHWGYMLQRATSIHPCESNCIQLCPETSDISMWWRTSIVGKFLTAWICSCRHKVLRCSKLFLFKRWSCVHLDNKPRANGLEHTLYTWQKTVLRSFQPRFSKRGLCLKQHSRMRKVIAWYPGFQHSLETKYLSIMTTLRNAPNVPAVPSVPSTLPLRLESLKRRF